MFYFYIYIFYLVCIEGPIFEFGGSFVSLDGICFGQLRGLCPETFEFAELQTFYSFVRERK